ncbi:MAG: pyrroloquinoline quinone biosynthesis protein PqqD [Rhodobacterales bacterium 32-67-9]|nr:MAG: pyrroloquinoline quinone biosynthesis protein PqqD [Rhodobacterales bacterium 32-67-9]
MSITPASVPVLPRGVRLHHDRVRDTWVLLAPERAIRLDPVGHAVLAEIDGTRSFATIVATLAGKYDAPPERIAEDSRGLLTGLLNRRMLELTE